MGYSHCEKHDEAATNGCESCYKEDLAALSDAEVLRRVAVLDYDDRYLEKRLFDIARRLDQMDVPGVGNLCMACHGERATTEPR